MTSPSFWPKGEVLALFRYWWQSDLDSETRAWSKMSWRHRTWRNVIIENWRHLPPPIPYPIHDIRGYWESVPDPRLIVLDTLAGIRPIRTTNGYTEDYESLSTLHQLANEKGFAIPVLHHTRKMEAEDPLNTVSGTLGLAGCADTVLVLNRSSQGTTLYVRGRDIEEGEHAVSFDKHACRWTILGNASEVHRSNERGKILDALLNVSELLGRLPTQHAWRATTCATCSGKWWKPGRS
jgi:hypothetical protein